MKNLFYIVPAQADESGFPTYRSAISALESRKLMNRGTELIVVRVLAHAKLTVVEELEEFPSADARIPPRK